MEFGFVVDLVKVSDSHVDPVVLEYDAVQKNQLLDSLNRRMKFNISIRSLVHWLNIPDPLLLVARDPDDDDDEELEEDDLLDDFLDVFFLLPNPKTMVLLALYSCLLEISSITCITSQ